MDKWFGNARWSFNHPEGRKTNVTGKDVKEDTTPLPRADKKSNRKELPNGAVDVEVPEADAHLPGSSEKENEKGKELLDPNRGRGSTAGNEEDKANNVSAGQPRRIQMRRKSVS